MNPSKSPASHLRPESETGVRILQPSGWPAPKGYANGMTAEGRLVVTGERIVIANGDRLQADFSCLVY